MTELKVTKVLEKMKNGMTTPFLVRCNDKREYVIKSTSNYTKDATDEISSKYLFNELFSARLARQLKLDIPDFKTPILTDEVINSNSEMQLCGLLPGTCFASEYRKATPGITNPFIKISKNKSMLPSIILFDQLLMNRDRGDRIANILFDKRLKKFLIIDNTEIFQLGGSWDKDLLYPILNRRPPFLSGDLDGTCYKLISNLVRGENDFRNIIANSKEIDYDSLISNIPTDWNISMEDKELAVYTLKSRVNEIDSIIKELHEKIFSHWRGVS